MKNFGYAIAFVMLVAIGFALSAKRETNITRKKQIVIDSVKVDSLTIKIYLNSE